MKRFLLLLSFVISHLSFSSVAAQSSADADPNFYIYLCFGQSNMEGNAKAESVDKTNVDERFQMLATTNFDSPKRTMGNWYKATPPIVSPIGGLGMADYFGRTMVAALPLNVKVGVVDVAIGGCDIRMFDKDKYSTYAQKDDWSGQLARQYYGGNPYKRLIDMAKKAQEVGVIKGILLHQGCTNNNDPNWPTMVKKIYNDMLTDLGLSADSVPIFAGETLRKEEGGACYDHNKQVARLPEFISTAHTVSSLGCPGNGQDPWHFNAVGYRIMGKRYAYATLKVMGLDTKANPDYQMPAALQKFYSLKEFVQVDDVKIAAGYSRKITPVMGKFNDNHSENLTEEVAFSSEDFELDGNMVKTSDDKIGTVVAAYTDFMGQDWSQNIIVAVGTMRNIQGIEDDRLSPGLPVYNLLGVKVAAVGQWDSLPQGLYIVNGKKISK